MHCEVPQSFHFSDGLFNAQLALLSESLLCKYFRAITGKSLTKDADLQIQQADVAIPDLAASEHCGALAACPCTHWLWHNFTYCNNAPCVLSLLAAQTLILQSSCSALKAFHPVQFGSLLSCISLATLPFVACNLYAHAPCREFATQCLLRLLVQAQFHDT